MTQILTGDKIPEAEPAFDLHARPVDGATTARMGQRNVPVKQRYHVPGRDGADDEGGAGPRDQVGARSGVAQRVVVIQEVGGHGFGGGIDCVVRAVVVVVVPLDGFRVNLVEDHWRSGGQVVWVEMVVLF